jgi:hypothetical protein
MHRLLKSLYIQRVSAFYLLLAGMVKPRKHAKSMRNPKKIFRFIHLKNTLEIRS